MLQSIDLNLLPVLEQLIATQSLTRTAAALNLSVPAVSRALGRIRLVIGDPVLVRSGRGLVLTPKGAALGEELRGCLERIETLIRPAAPRPLAEVRRTFRVRCNDVCAGLMAGSLFARLQREAPGIELQLESDAGHNAEKLRAGEADLVVSGDPRLPPETRLNRLYDERLVGLARKDHPLFERRVTIPRFCAHPHVLAAPQLEFESLMQNALKAHGRQRTVGIVVPTFFAAATAAVESNLLATMPGLMALQLRRFLPLQAFAVPVELPAIPVNIAWHPRHDHDPEHVWLREHVAAEVRRAAKALGRLTKSAA